MGRKALENPKLNKLTLRVDDEFKEKVFIKATREGKSVSEILFSFLTEYVKEN